jgi:hypothetical protein
VQLQLSSWRHLGTYAICSFRILQVDKHMAKQKVSIKIAEIETMV